MTTVARPAIRRAIAASVLLLTLVFVWRVVAWRPQPIVPSQVSDRFVRVSGIAHVHTTHSDGSGSVEDVEGAAAAAGLDFVIVTDHNSLAAKPQEGYGPAGVLTLVGTEISNRQGHLLAMRIPRLTYQFSGDASEALLDVADLGGLSFAAHPESEREDLRWNDWDLPGSWGVELFNGDSQWRAAGWVRQFGALVRYPLNPDYALLRLLRRPTALDRWDDVLTKRRATGITGADAHGTLTTLSPALPFPSYEAVFRIAQNYVLLSEPLRGNAAADGAAILDALARGRLYVGLGALAPADQFFFEAERGNERWTMGDDVPATGLVRLRAGGGLPAIARVTLLHNGMTLASADGALDQRVADPGVYRVEVHLPGWSVPWIVSNPIYLVTAEERSRRLRAAALPAPVVVGDAVDVERFETRSTFAAVADRTTTLDAQFIAPGAGPDGSNAARLAFQLGIPTPDDQSPFASLGSYVPRDFTDREGLVFSVRSDVPYRLWVQIRDLEPPDPEGADTWQGSVRSSTTWQDVTVPFARLRNVIDDPLGTLELGETQAIVFLVDIGAVPPGTAGTIWIDNLRVY